MRNYSIETHCPICLKRDAISCPAHEVEAFKQGAHIQDAFKSLSIDQQEQLLTGTCGPCWTNWADRMDAKER